MGRSATMLTAGAVLLLTAAIAFGVVALDDDDGKTSASPSTAEQLIAFYGERIEHDPADYVSYTKLGESYVRLARESGDTFLYNEAEVALRTALELQPDDLAARAQLATVLIATHEFAEALAIAEAVYAEDPSATQALATIGDAHMALGNYGAARTAYEGLAEKATAPSVYSRLAHVEEIHGDPSAAESYLRRAEALAVERGQTGEALAWYRFQLGELALHSGRVDDAERWYADALDAYPGYFEAIAGLGSVQAARGNDAGAVELLEEAAAQVEDAGILTALGDLYTRMGDDTLAQERYDEAERIARRAANLGPRFNRELANFYADLAVNTGEAVELALAELELRRDIEGLNTAAWALYRDGRAEEAAPLMAEALRLGTQDAHLYFHAGLISHALGDDATARAHLERALEIDPHFSILLVAEARATLETIASAVTGSGLRPPLTLN